MGHEAAVLKSIAGETMALLGVTAKGSVNGLLFELGVEQRYRNPSSTNIEAVYTFPLPSGAVLLDFDVKLGDKLLTGVVVERKAAEKQYEDAIDKGDTAIMLERAGDGLCTVNLGNLMAGEEATIRYRYAQLLRFEHGSVRLTVPTVIAPRYGNPAQGGLQPHQAPATDLAVEYPFALSLELRGAIAAGTIASPSHQIATACTEDGVTVTLARNAWLDRDFVLTASGLPAQSLTTVAKDGDGYVALASFCAEVPKTAEELPLRLKLVADCSGSMAGDSIEAAKRALHRIFAGLTPTDRFSFTRFGSRVVHEIDALVPADSAAIRKAGERLARTTADLGGTEMEAALRSVFGLGGAEGAADVLLITDGEIWAADSLMAAARSAKQRVFVVGIGSAPSEGVLRHLADATGGTCEFVAPNEDAEAAILRMFARLRAPRVERADIVWPQAPKWVTPIAQGLFGGETIRVFAGFDSPPAGDVTLRLLPAGGGTALTARVALPGAAIEGATCARMAAATRIESADDETKLALALRYSLVTDRTNFVVVHARAEGEKAQSLPELRTIAQMHAAGWGGMGTVRGSRPVIHAHRVLCADIDDFDLPVSRLSGEAMRSAPPKFDDFDDAGGPARAPSINEFLRAMDRAISNGLRGAMPLTVADVARLGAPPAVVDALRALVAEGYDEARVVREFLASLEARAFALGLSRELLRELRQRFSSPDAQRDLRDRMATIVGSATQSIA